MMTVGITGPAWSRVIEGGEGRTMFGGRAGRRARTPDCEPRFGAAGAIHGCGSGSSTVNDAVCDVRRNDLGSIASPGALGRHSTACEPGRQRVESDQSPPSLARNPRSG